MPVSKPAAGRRRLVERLAVPQARATSSLVDDRRRGGRGRGRPRASSSMHLGTDARAALLELDEHVGDRVGHLGLQVARPARPSRRRLRALDRLVDRSRGTCGSHPEVVADVAGQVGDPIADHTLHSAPGPRRCSSRSLAFSQRLEAGAGMWRGRRAAPLGSRPARDWATIDRGVVDGRSPALALAGSITVAERRGARGRGSRSLSSRSLRRERDGAQRLDTGTIGTSMPLPMRGGRR